jgi:hypothetical protein
VRRFIIKAKEVEKYTAIVAEFPSPFEWKEQRTLEKYIKEASVSIVHQIFALAINDTIDDLTFRRDTIIFLRDFLEKTSKKEKEEGTE